MVRSTWAELTAPLDASDLALFEAYRKMCRALPGVTEEVHKTEVHYVVERIFSSGYLKSHHLEISIDLLREAEGEHLRTAFHTTKKVITHRFTIDSLDELATVKDLLREARDTVGPGLKP